MNSHTPTRATLTRPALIGALIILGGFWAITLGNPLEFLESILVGGGLVVGMAVTVGQQIKRQEGNRGSGAVAASTILYEGTLCFVNATGYLAAVVANGANKFAGIVIYEKDNSAGSAGDLSTEYYREGIFELTGTGFTQADVGKAIYATDNFTITTDPSGGSFVGSCEEYVSSTKLRVKLHTGETDVVPVTVTATADGLTTGLIPANASHVTIVCDTATKQVTLPANVVGKRIVLSTPTANGCELICADAAAKINDVVCGATNEAALVADSHFVAECISSTEWILRGFTKLGADIAAIVPDGL